MLASGYTLLVWLMDIIIWARVDRGHAGISILSYIIFHWKYAPSYNGMQHYKSK